MIQETESQMKTVFNTDEDTYRYDVEMLVNSFYPKRENDDNIKTDMIQHLNIVIDKENNLISVWVEEKTDKGNGSISCKTEGKCLSCDKKEIKNTIKQLVYKTLSTYTGKELPWGILTGIRPTKIAMAVLEEGYDANKTDGQINKSIESLLKDYYYVSDEKTNLAIDIARREREILKSIDYKDGYSLYIGIPFCPTTCLYCSFTSYPIGMYREKADRYVDCLIKEIEVCSKKFKDKKLNTIYFGGGTPTTLSADQLKRIFAKIEEVFDFTYLQEYTVEAGRPDSITEDRLKALKDYNITRISVNPQTMKQETLDIIGRKHSVDDVRKAFYLARGLGFDNINMDFIAGLPNESIDDVRNTMEEVLKLNPDSMTVHSLAIKRAAALNIFKDKYKEMTIENNVEIMELCQNYAEMLNMKPYYMYRQKNMAGNMENVGYAKDGKAGIYNILIMEEKQTILALGAGAVTKYVFPYGGRIERCDNVKNADQYMDRIDEMIVRKEKFIDTCNMG